jgi:hypothetical protein
MSKKKVAENQEEKKVLVVKKWTITVTTFDDGTRQMQRTNDGFNPLELIEITDFISWEVREQMLGRIVPDTVKREVVV